MAERRTGAQWLRTTLAGRNRIAGHGCIEDNYDEDSGCPRKEKPWEAVRFPSDNVEPESLNGPVIIVQKGRKKE